MTAKTDITVAALLIPPTVAAVSTGETVFCKPFIHHFL